MERNALIVATVGGLVLQLAMVVGGHYSPAVAALFAVGGMGFSLIAGLLYVWFAVVKGGWSVDLQGGAVAGGVCALLGIAASVVLGDVPPSLLLLGTVSSVVTGAIGGAIGKLIFG
jgi:hypothetical protein